MEITSDPHELRRLAGFRTVAEVYRTLDKLAIRKEYHEALLRHNMDLDAIVSGIKTIAEISEEDAVRLNAYKILLKSLGLDEYRETDIVSKESWEDIVRKKEYKKLKVGEYEVIKPIITEDAQKQLNEEQEIEGGLYDK